MRLPTCACARKFRNFCASDVLLYASHYCLTTVLGGLGNFLMRRQKSSKLAGYVASESISTQPEGRKISRKWRFFIQGNIFRAFSTKPTLSSRCKKFNTYNSFIFCTCTLLADLITLARFRKYLRIRFRARCAQTGTSSGLHHTSTVSHPNAHLKIKKSVP